MKSTQNTPRGKLAFGASALALCLLGATLAAAPLQQSCDEAERQQVARAQRITSNTQLIGGASARGEVGDWLLENDHVRVIVQDTTYNRGSGLFGGSLIDADIVRLGEERDLLAGNGRDSFGELFPAYFLEVMDPEEIEIINDGTNGEAAVIEVRGRGGEFVTMARLLNQVMVNSYAARENITRALQGKPPRLDQEPQVQFTVRYILEPDARHVRVESAIRNVSLKKLEFPNSSIVSLLTTALGVDLGEFSVPAGHVLGFGKLNSPFLPGIGYDLQFGLQDAYGDGVDLPALPGHRTPIVASSSLEGISYGFVIEHGERGGESAEAIAAREHFVYAKDQELNAEGEPFYGGDANPDDMLFLFYASGFGGVFTHQLPAALAPSFCAEDVSAEQACEAYVGACEGDDCQARVDACVTAHPKCVEQRDEGLPSEFVYTSYLLIGDGDVSSLWDEAYRIRGEEVSRVRGRVIDGYNGQPAGQRESFLIYKARTDTSDASAQCAEGEEHAPIIWSQAFSQRGGFFELTLPPGVYCYRTRAPGRELGPYVRFEVEEGKDLYIEPVMRPAGRIEALALDEAGNPLPARVTVVGTHPYVEGVETPREFLFDLRAGERWRTTDMVPDDPDDPETRRYIERIVYTGANGQSNFRVRPNPADAEGDEARYLVYFSRGPEYEVDVREVTVKPNETVRVTGKLVRSVDTTGYLSGDFHLHARGSIDSGLDYNRRVISLAGEGLEIAVSSDHNYISDFRPYILGNDLVEFMNSSIGLELTTFEAGHFNAFPLEYDVELANRGSFEWQNQAPGLIFEELRQRGTLPPDETIVQVNHPRDTILGYFSQHNVNALDATVELPFQAEDASIIDAVAAPNGAAFYQEKEGDVYESTFSWNFDAIEIFNGKRFELLRHFRASKETLLPVYTEFYTTSRLDEQGLEPADCEDARAQLAGDECAGDPTADGCSDAQATADACTAAEAEGEISAENHLAMLGDGEVIVCDDNEVAFPGHLDDWYNMLNNDRPYALRDYERDAIQDEERLAQYEALYKKYTATGNSDSHKAEFDDPGYPRNYFWAGHDDPAQFTDEQLSRAVKEHNIVVTNGPFVLIEVDGQPMGSEVEISDGQVEVLITIRSATWADVDRFRLIANGEVVATGDVELTDNEWQGKVTVDIDRDTWFVVEVEGDESMFPVLAPNEIPPFDLEQAIGSLAGPFGFGGGPEGLEPHLTFQVKPFAFTNPIWVVADGDGKFDPPNTPQTVCQSGVIPTNEAGVLAPGAARKLGSRRLDAINAPFPVKHEEPVTSRLKGEVRDVRLIFEAWGHSH